MPAYNTFNNPWMSNPYYVPVVPNYYPNNTTPTQNVLYGQSVPTQQPQPQPQFSNVWFNGGENEARMFPVAPNNAVALWSETEPVIYVKKADMAGKPSFIIYDLVERGAAVEQAPSIPEQVPTPKFATEEDVKNLMLAVKNLGDKVGVIQGSFDKMNSEIDTMKGDVYGIAGKKKTIRKDAVEEDG